MNKQSIKAIKAKIARIRKGLKLIEDDLNMLLQEETVKKDKVGELDDGCLPPALAKLRKKILVKEPSIIKYNDKSVKQGVNPQNQRVFRASH